MTNSEGAIRPWWRRLTGLPGEVDDGDLIDLGARSDGPLGRLSLTRRHAYRDAYRPYIVYVDDQPVAKIADDESISVDLPVGTHTLQLRVGIAWTSKVCHLVVQPSAVEEWICEANRGKRPVPGLTMVFVAVLRHRYISLYRTSSEANNT